MRRAAAPGANRGWGWGAEDLVVADHRVQPVGAQHGHVARHERVLRHLHLERVDAPTALVMTLRSGCRSISSGWGSLGHAADTQESSREQRSLPLSGGSNGCRRPTPPSGRSPPPGPPPPWCPCPCTFAVVADSDLLVGELDTVFTDSPGQVLPRPYGQVMSFPRPRLADERQGLDGELGGHLPGVVAARRRRREEAVSGRRGSCPRSLPAATHVSLAERLEHQSFRGVGDR
jgi:hypothetical protein